MNTETTAGPAGPICVTGALGKVASRFLPFLPADYDLRLTDLREGAIGNRPVVPLDLMDREKAIAFFEGAQAIVHCAIAPYQNDALDADHPLLHDYHRSLLDINVRGVYHICEAARIHRIPKIIYLSSLSIVLGHPFESGLGESLPPKPGNLYACSKLFGEQIAELYHRLHGIEVISLRVAQPYPQGTAKEEIWKNDPRVRALFVSYRDIARAVDCAVRAEKVGFGAYNIFSRDAEGKLDCAASAIGFEPQDICIQEAAGSGG